MRTNKIISVVLLLAMTLGLYLPLIGVAHAQTPVTNFSIDGSELNNAGNWATYYSGYYYAAFTSDLPVGCSSCTDRLYYIASSNNGVSWNVNQIPNNVMGSKCGALNELSYGPWPGFFFTGSQVYFVTADVNSSSSTNGQVCWVSGTLGPTGATWNTASSMAAFWGSTPQRLSIGVAANGDVWISALDNGIQNWIAKNGVYYGNNVCGLGVNNGIAWEWVNLGSGSDIAVIEQAKNSTTTVTQLEYCVIKSGTAYLSHFSYPHQQSSSYISSSYYGQPVLIGSTLYLAWPTSITGTVSGLGNTAGCLLFKGTADTTTPLLTYVSAPLPSEVPCSLATDSLGTGLTVGLVGGGVLEYVNSTNDGSTWGSMIDYVTGRNTGAGDGIVGAQYLSTTANKAGPVFLWDEAYSSSVSPSCGSGVCLFSANYPAEVTVTVTKIVAPSLSSLAYWLFPLLFLSLYMAFFIGFAADARVSTRGMIWLMLTSLSMGGMLLVIMGALSFLVPMIIIILSGLYIVRFQSQQTGESE